ncbi:MAG: hypothetical protein NTV49_15255 [Kiritimatiellaeota bacterium]|nr:hypothetical protein [Kiritimatiellota bacterium]
MTICDKLRREVVAGGICTGTCSTSKSGSYMRNRWRRRRGRAAPWYGLRPEPLPASRIAVEWVIAALILVGGTRAARQVLAWMPEAVIGPLFNRLRLLWKGWSKLVKRKGLGMLTMIVEET